MKIAQKTRHRAALRGCDLKSEPGSIPQLEKETRKRHNREPVAICLALAVGHTGDGAPRGRRFYGLNTNDLYWSYSVLFRSCCFFPSQCILHPLYRDQHPYAYPKWRNTPPCHMASMLLQLNTAVMAIPIPYATICGTLLSTTAAVTPAPTQSASIAKIDSVDAAYS